ncbi:MAG: YihY/virulence factor BrkB family protein [Phycisphaerae bacterium]|nr:YihY/virulence factor BrkB family protein [Phycisphaerae bacterium]
MPQLQDIRPVVRSIGWRTLLKRIWAQAGEDDLFTWAASLAYAWIFAIFPFLIFLLTLVPLMPVRSRQYAGGEIKSALNALGDAAMPLKQQVDAILNTTHGGLLSIGLIVSVWAASGGVSMTMTALDRCYDIKIGRTYIRQRFLALLLTMVTSVLIILVMILLPVSSAIVHWCFHRYPAFYPILMLINVVRYGVSLLLMMAVLALLYHFGPSFERPFRFLTPGAVFSACVWLLFAFFFRLYIQWFGEKSYNATYGAVAGVAILLLFFYIDAVVLLLGAEINSEIDFAVFGIASDGDIPDSRGPLKPLTPAQQRLVKELTWKRKRGPRESASSSSA